MKVIHVVESLDHGAVENWLVRMLRHARASAIDVDWTFYCVEGKGGALDEEVRRLGASVIHSPVAIGRKWEFIRALRQALREGRYDILHCHHDLVSAVYLLAAVGIPMSRRIVQVHNADEGVPSPSRFKQRLYREPLRRVCLAMADRIVGISNHTLDTFLAGRPRRQGKDIVLYYGVDAKPFIEASGNRTAFCDELGLAKNSRLVLFLGRMVPEKNPLFAVDVLAELRRIDPKIAGIFVGSGSLEPAVSERADAHGLRDALRQLGWRRDVANIMSCCDLFILPRPEQPLEGFGLAVVEAQLAGLRLLLSQGVVDDPLLPTAVYRRLALSAGSEAWAKAGIELLREPTPSRAAALAALETSPFNLDFALRRLRELHDVKEGISDNKRVEHDCARIQL